MKLFRTFVAMLAVLGVLAGCSQRPEPRGGKQDRGQPSAVDTSAPAFVGSSATLKNTVVLPTLETPFSEHTSAIRCSSFQLAWIKFEHDFTHGPVQLQNAEQFAVRLNKAGPSAADLSPQDYFVAAGPAGQVIATVRRELADRFPGTEPPRIDVPSSNVYIAFAFLKAGVRYAHEFNDNPNPFGFVDSSGKSTSVHSFGILPVSVGGDRDSPPARKQVMLRWQSGAEFAVDLCRESQPNQLVLACLARKGTLAELFANEELRFQKSPAPAEYRLYEDELLVPNMSWRVEHHFKELEGPDKILRNGPSPGLFLGAAFQEIQFKLDRRGAEVTSSGYVSPMDGGPKTFYFNRPFLIYLKKRDAKYPFFVMWVDNAELMQVRSTRK
jgi:hypothetical protein